MKQPVSVTLEMEARQVESLDQLASESGRSRAALIREAVRTYLRRRGRS
jgi:predicted transcriptional regulator